MIYSNYYACHPKTCKPTSARPVQAHDVWHTPLMNLQEDAQQVKVELSIPGVKKDQIRIHLEDQLLTITAERQLHGQETRALHREFTNRKFKKLLRLTEALDASSIKAQLEDGVLHIQIAKTPVSQTQINVQ